MQNAMHLWNVVMIVFANNFPVRERSIICFAKSMMRKDDSVPVTIKLPDAVIFHGYIANRPNIYGYTFIYICTNRGVGVALGLLDTDSQAWSCLGIFAMANIRLSIS